MWNIISNISAIVTLALFVLYIIGHWWSIKNSKRLLYEKFEVENLTDDELNAVDTLIDLEQSGGEVFSISSPNGIRRASIYDAEYNSSNNKIIKKKLLKELTDINVNEKIYVRAYIPEGIPNQYVEIEKYDYIKIEFLIALSGKNGELVKVNYKCKLTFKAWIYYLCS